MRRDRIFKRILHDEGYEASVERIHASYARAESAWLKRYGYRRLSPEKSVESYRRLDAMAFRGAFPEAPKPEAARLSKLMRRRWAELERDFPLRLYPDAEPTLRRLKRQRLRLGLVSNAPPDTGDVVLRLGLGRFLDCAVISGEVGVSKPNPEIFRIALSRTGVPPSQAIHVGDVYEADIVGAAAAGMTGILLDRDGSAPKFDCPTVSGLRGVFDFL